MSEPSERKFELRPLWKAAVDDYATAVSYSSTGTEAAVAAASGEIHVLDARSGRSRWKALAHRRGVLAVSWSPTSPVLASAGQDGSARLFSSDGRQLAELPGSAAWVELLAWSPDGSKLATASGKVVRIWNADGTPHLETEPHASAVTGLAWNRNGSELATCCYGGVDLWSVAAGAKSRHLPWKGSLISLAWSPDDRVIACASQDCSVHFWRLDTGKDSEMTGYPFKSRAIGWDSRGSLLATTGETTLTVWDFSGRGPEGTAPLQLKGHKSLVTQLAFNPRKAVLASGSQDFSVLVWEPRRSQAPVAYGFLENAVSGLAWDPQSESFVGIDADGNVSCWKART